MSNSSASASASASSSAAADPSLLIGEYEVFLSFCGQDTRQGFTDHLYTSLNREGIHTFRDNEGLHVGEEIGPELLKAITDSKISIPIFSKNYAGSKWCLLELTHMVQCLENRGQKILPIFYDVDPYDVRHQTGIYEEAFRQHKKRRYDENAIQGWKDALKKVGQLKGLELEKETAGREGQLVTIITDTVLEILMQNNKHEDSYLVGMPSRIEKVEKLLNIHYDGVRFIGIHGMGGLGKTTIAEAIYNKYQHRFECHSFLPDVRETESHNGIVHLQNQLLSAIFKTRTGVNDYKDGIRQIKGVFGRRKVLIVLDDVNEESQIKRLAGSWEWFGARSRIIITTRNKEVLRALETTTKEGHPEVYGSYQPDYLNSLESLELFCKHAFKSKNPPEDYYTLSDGIASTAAGLPLVLKVTGSSLYGETDKELWKEKIYELKELLDEEVQKKLRLSFDPLSFAQKEIFVDIACLFIGQKKINPCYMWDDCGFYPRNVLDVLVCRSLITVGDDDILRMHDQLRDLGRQIACEGKLDEWGRWSRLWDSDKAFEVYRSGKGTEKVKALCLDDFKFKLPRRRYLEGEKFLRLPHLRYLTLHAMDTLYGDFEHCLPNLRWLQWRRCYLKSITPTNLHLRNLVILDLSFSSITEDWDLWNQIQMSKKLKVLDLSGCSYLERVPFLSTFSNLERLVVNHCKELCSLHGIEELESLRYLDARCCKSLKTLPNLSRLTKLKELKVKGCELITDIPGLDKLESLELLSMAHKSLERFDFRGLGRSLEVLDMSTCRNIERVFGVVNLKRLKILNIQGCPKLIEIHGLEGLESLGCLVMHHCESIETLPDLSKLKSLKALSVRAAVKLTEIRGLEELKSLEYLDIAGCMSIEHLPDFSNLRKLEVINASGCWRITEIRGLENLESFGDLFINRGQSLDTQMYSQLSRIRILTLDKFIHISGISELYLPFNVSYIQVISSMISF